MTKMRCRKWFVCLLTVMMVLTMMPTMAFAQTGNVCQIDGKSAYTSLEAALEAADEGDTIRLTQSFSLEANVSVEKDVTLDLNGQTLTTGSFTIKIAGGDLTVQDKSESADGKITGTAYIIDMNASGGDKVTLESGTLEGTGWSAVARINSQDVFEMKGGTARQTQSNALYVLFVNGGTVNILGGRIEGSIRGISASAASSTVVVGTIPAAGAGNQTAEEAARVYASGVYSSSASANIVLNSGTVGRVFGTVGESFVLNCWFEQDVSGYLPSGLIATEKDGHWIVEELTAENAAARIGDVFYGSVVKAASELQDGETLVLLKDYAGNQSIKTSAHNVIIDLNGHSITNTAENGYGLDLATPSGTPDGESGVEIRNSGADEVVITADVPVYAHSGNSMYLLPVTLGEGIKLETTAEDGTYIVLGTSACMEYTDAVASYIKTGGFLANQDDGKQYVYGSFVQAAQNDVDNTAVLLNDYDGSISLSSENVDLTLDLNENTVTSSGTSVIRINTNNSTLTIKNGTMINEKGTGAEVGIPAAGGSPYNNVTLNLENVDLTATGSEASDYGIVSNGTSTGININLKGGSVTANNMIGIYFPPADSTLTIDGTTITGTTGVAVKGGTVNILNNAEITGTGVANPATAVNSGVSNTGNALYVEGNYDRTVSVNIVSGTLSSDYGQAVQKLDVPAASGEKEIVITGGTFSTDVTEFLHTGLTAPEDSDGMFTVQKLSNVYVNGASGKDINSGANADNAVKTLEQAARLVADDGVIYICGQVTVNDVLEIDGVTIERADGYNGSLIYVSGNDAELTFSNTTIDGKNSEDTFDSGYLISASNNAVLNIEDGTKLINNSTTAVSVLSSTLNMNGGEISGNTAAADGGAVYAYSAQVNLNGGEIKDNSTSMVGGGICFLGEGTLSLDGAKITGNSARSGGGIYIESMDGDAVLIMKSGEISENRLIVQTDADGYKWMSDGAGIGAFYGDYRTETIVDIQGGTIKDNVAYSADDDVDGAGEAISLNSLDDRLSPTLKLSGSPLIEGDVYLWDYETGTPVIEVAAGFEPKAPVEIDANYMTEGKAVVSFDESITGEEAESFFTSSAASAMLASNGNNQLEWLDLVRVSFKTPDNRETYKTVYVRPDSLIDESLIPALGDGSGEVAAPAGYDLSHWVRYGQTEAWDFNTDTVSGTTMTLLAVFELKTPNVSVTADDNTPHTGTDAVLTVTAAHELNGVTYEYQWYKDGTAISGETGNTLIVSEEGSYTVKVLAVNGTEVSEEVESDAVVVTVEGHVYVPTVTKPTCTEQGYTTYTCSVCGDSYIADYTKPTDHSFSSQWSTDDENHWHACVNGDAIADKEAHNFAWVTDKEATASEKGSKHEECTVCGYSKAAVEIPALGQSDEGGSDNDGGNVNDDKPSTDLPSKTGDINDMMPFMIIIVISAVVMMILTMLRRKSSQGDSKK